MELCEFVFHVYKDLSSSPPGEDQLYHTLFELYLTETSHFLAQSDLSDVCEHSKTAMAEDIDPCASGEFGALPPEEDKREKALGLLKEGWMPGDTPKYDPEHMLVLCRMYHFKDGLVFLYERKSLLREVLQVAPIVYRPLSLSVSKTEHRSTLMLKTMMVSSLLVDPMAIPPLEVTLCSGPKRCSTLAQTKKTARNRFRKCWSTSSAKRCCHHSSCFTLCPKIQR